MNRPIKKFKTLNRGVARQGPLQMEPLLLLPTSPSQMLVIVLAASLYIVL